MYKVNPHPNTKGIMWMPGQCEACYYGGGSRSFWKEPMGHSTGTDKPDKYQKIDHQGKEGGL